ncbi:MAG: glycosyltransferase family 4 protein [Candidatus Peribacteraceae bacterium]|nr:glycosyltransferase family 4 protein [Candidatus Peribacteraceae bacterium]
MKIVLLNDDMLPEARGGAAVVVDRLRRAFTEQGHEVMLISTHQDTANNVRNVQDGIGRIMQIPVRYDFRKRHRYCVSKPAGVLDAIDAALREYKPDIVHAHNVHSSITYSALRVAQRHTDSLFLTAHDTFLVSFGRVCGGAYERDALAGRGHHMRFTEHIQAVGRRYWPLRNSAIRRILEQTGTQVIAISEALKIFLEANGIRVSAVVHNGVEVNPPIGQDAVGTFRHTHKLTGPTILYGGRMSEDKGSLELLRAFPLVRKHCPNAQLLLLGDPERIASALDMLSQQDRQGVILAGWLPQEQVRIAFAAATVVTTPSIYLDSFNLMNIEAMAEGTPVVGTCFGGTPETIVDGVTGYVCNPHETSAYAQALTTILSDSSLAKRMGDAARVHVVKEFSLEKQAAQYMHLYSRA